MWWTNVNIDMIVKLKKITKLMIALWHGAANVFLLNERMIGMSKLRFANITFD